MSYILLVIRIADGLLPTPKLLTDPSPYPQSLARASGQTCCRLAVPSQPIWRFDLKSVLHDEMRSTRNLPFIQHLLSGSAGPG